MKRRATILLAAGLLLVARISQAQDESEKGSPRDVAAVKEAVDGWWTQSMKSRDQRLQWWRDARFGCFIHWGVYSGPGGVWDGKSAGTYSEHLMQNKRIPLDEYKQKVVSVFDPEQFNADQWVVQIKNAGMKYLIITAKHHDGFAMWPSQLNNYNIHDATRFKRDPMQELSDACHRNGIRFGFYYSHAMDWADPDSPGNDWDYQNPGGSKQLFGGKQWPLLHPELVDRVQHYVDGKAIPQVKELIAKYHPDILWFDVNRMLPLSLQLRVVRAVREADPNVVINGRAARGLGYNFGDYLDTADRPAELRPTEGDWECIPTCNESYGYHKLDNHYKTPAHFIQLLAKAAAKGGNVLLNIGPTGDGVIDPKSADILAGVGKWMAVNSESIHATKRTPLDRQAWGESTLKNDTLYLHVFNWPADGKLVVGGLQSEAIRAYLLADPAHTQLTMSRLNANDIVIRVPNSAPDPVDSVIVLKSQGELKAVPGRLLALNGIANHLLAFDAHHQGHFTFGDGKTPNWYAEGFTTPTDSMDWSIRLNEPARFNVSVNYRLSPATAPVIGEIEVGDQRLAFQLTQSKTVKDTSTVDLGQLNLPPGSETLKIRSTQQHAGFELFELVLTPK